MTEFERKEWEMKKALLGTIPFYPQWAGGSQIIEPVVIKAYCTKCNPKNRIYVRNRSPKTGIYWITAKEAMEFAKIGNFALPQKSKMKEYIIVTDFCACCGEKKGTSAKLILFPIFKKTILYI